MQIQKFFATFLIFAVFLSFFYPFSETKAAISPIQQIKPFGGKITKIQACMSPAGFILTIGPPVGGKYFLDPAKSKIKAYGVIKPQVCVLGNASPAPINCDKGNPDGIGGFSVGGLLGGAVSGGGIVDMNVVTMETIEPGNIFGSQIMGIELVGPGGALFIGGDLGIQLAGMVEGLGGILPGIGIISSLISGNFLGAGLGLAAVFVPVIGPAIALASFIFSALGITFGKKPPSLGSAYPITEIGTGPKPAPIGICPQIPLLAPAL